MSKAVYRTIKFREEDYNEIRAAALAEGIEIAAGRWRDNPMSLCRFVYLAVKQTAPIPHGPLAVVWAGFRRNLAALLMRLAVAADASGLVLSTREEGEGEILITLTERD